MFVQRVWHGQTPTVRRLPSLLILIFARSSLKAIEFPPAPVAIAFLFLRVTLPFTHGPDSPSADLRSTRSPVAVMFTRGATTTNRGKLLVLHRRMGKSIDSTTVGVRTREIFVNELQDQEE